MKSLKSYNQNCSLALALDTVGDRWTLLIIRDLLSGPRRFKDIVSGMPGAGTNLISNRLKMLMEHGLIQKESTEFEVQVYRITETGSKLSDAVIALARWGLQYKVTRNGFWSPWWNPIAIQARYDGSLPKKSKFVGHIIVDQVTTEVTLKNGVLSAKNSSEKTPDFIARTTIQLEDSPPKKLKDFEISGDREKAKTFLKALSFS